MKRTVVIVSCLMLLLATPALAGENIPTRLIVPGTFDFRIVMQSDLTDVSKKLDVVALFELPREYGVIGLLAHNYLAGHEFYRLLPGQALVVKFDDGTWRTYRIVEIHQYQALGDNYPFFEFVDLQIGQIVTDQDIFDQIYTVPNTLVLQTCLSKAGDPDWGLTFWIAYPAQYWRHHARR